MFCVIESEGKFKIHVNGMFNLNPIVVLEDIEFAYEYCENLKIAYNIGYENGKM